MINRMRLIVSCLLRCASGLAYLVLIPWVAFWASSSAAHEVRPSYLELSEVRPGEFDVLFKTPMRGDLRLALTPAFSGSTESLTPIMGRATGDAAIQTWRIKTIDPLRGQKIGIAGLENTMTDALVRIVFLDGSTWVQRLTPQVPVATIPARQNGWSIAGLYLKLGIEHILFGVDHLLFVLAMLIIARETWQLIKTVTAFTVAHSITLALATLGYVHVPSAPVEAVIALSIVFVAREIVREQQGEAGITAKLPWVVAFTFGLLHGLGFAGALSEVGLPEGHIPLALLFFNIGVEIGQLLFVAAVLALMALTQRIRIAWPQWTRAMPAYVIGCVAVFWVFERVSGF